jgi:hypothetical protein
MYGDSIDFGKFLLYKLIKKRAENQAAPCAHANLSLGKKFLTKPKSLVILVPLLAPKKTRKAAPDKGFWYIDCSGATKHSSANLSRIDWLSLRELSRTAEV